MKASIVHVCFVCTLSLTPMVSAASPAIVPDPEIQQQIEAAKASLYEPDARISRKDVAVALKDRNEGRLGVLVEQMVYNMVCCSSGERSTHAMLALYYSLDIDDIVVLRAAVPLLDSEQEGIAHEAADIVLGNVFASESGYDFEPLRRFLAEGGDLSPALASFVFRYPGTASFEAVVAEYVDRDEDRQELVRRAFALSELPARLNEADSLTVQQREALDSLSGDDRWWVRLYVPLALIPVKYFVRRDRGDLRAFVAPLATDPVPAVREAALELLPRGWESLP